MENFSKIEIWVAKILSNNPKLKALLKKAYQRVNYFFYRKPYMYKSPFKIFPVESDDSTFFGYYDKCPESSDGRYLIFFKTTFKTNVPPNPNQPIEIILKCLSSNQKTVIDKTFSYNWQQGAKMMWLSNEKFAYNIYCSESNKYLSKIYNITTKKFKILDLPIYDCFKDFYALTLNFNRLMEMRPDYGYRNYNEIVDYEKYDSDGVFKLSIQNNSSELFISIRQLIEYSYLPSMNGAKHKVNHIMISPDGQNFMFMHRWLSKSGKRYDRLFVSDSNSGNFKIVSDGGMVSHCCWKDNNTIVGYLRHNNKDGFYKINLNDLSVSHLSNKLEKFNDGHPTFQSDFMVFDSYPDRSRMKKLCVYNANDDDVMLIGEFFESFNFQNQSRCDLHPRFNNNKNKIYFDSVHEGARKLYFLELNK